MTVNNIASTIVNIMFGLMYIWLIYQAVKESRDDTE